MCGLCGIYNPGRNIEEDVLNRMTHIMHHRGPDGYGTWSDTGIGLGHRRLSIIDAKGGQQPWLSDDRSIVLVYNGELYNYPELKNRLVNYGHVFHSASDTEVLLRAYEHWGIDCVLHLNGMFAFAVWDQSQRRLLLARDHLGIKPLYYTQREGCLVFASEIKSLLQTGWCTASLDLDALSLLFSFRFVPSPRTLFSGIYKLPPGHRLVVTDKGLVLDRYWTWKPTIRATWNEQDLADEYAVRLAQAVKRQLRSDVPVGLFLSSGVDSATLLALMSQNTTQPVQTFTLGFTDNASNSELSDAARLACLYGAEHHQRLITAQDYLHYFERYINDLEEPVAHEPAPAFYFLAGLAANTMKVVLSGQGADEPWAGYDRHRGLSLSRWYSSLPVWLTHFIAQTAGRIPLPLERLKRGLSSLSEPDLTARLAGSYSFFSADLKQGLYRGRLKALHETGHIRSTDLIHQWQTGITHLDPLSQMLYMDTRSSLPDDLLMVADKTSMAHSLEVRVPYLDYQLIEFIESLPVHLKMRVMTGKYLHKKAVSRWVPHEVTHRRKKGFSHPVDTWLRTAFRPLIEELVLSPDSPLAPYF
ncbi:MAG: asparagine synthase (glutamine-hydrolyzing), partial [Methylococcaceae bacterium]